MPCLRWRLMVLPLMVGLSVGVSGAGAAVTTVMCTYRAPEGHTIPFLFDVAARRLVEAPDLFDADSTANVPLTVSENALAWSANDGSRMVLDRTTMVLSYELGDIGPIASFDCYVARKQL